MAIPNYRNAVYTNISATLESNTKKVIDVEIEHDDYGWIPYSCDPSEEDQPANTFSNQELYAALEADSNTTAYTPPTQSELDEELASLVRSKRDRILVSEVDPIVTNPLRWAELSTNNQTAYTNYRTALLGVPQQSGFPNSVTFPTLTLE